MKKSYFMLIALLFSTSLFAQKVVALHSPTNGIQYFDDDNPLQSAYTAAVDNDTLYLPGGSLAPPTKFEKKLTIYGAGHYPSSTTATDKTNIIGNVIFSDEADGSHLEGVVVSSNVYFDDNESVNDLVIKRCKINYLNITGNRTNPSENCTFQENIIYAFSIGNLINSNFFNNIIEANIPEARNLIFLNNIFLRSTYYHPVFDYADNCMIKNNIFLQESSNHGVADGSGESTYSHNIVCFSFDPENTSAFGTDPILDSNYIVTRADVLVDQTGGTFDYIHDYHLQAGTATFLGDDGYETGIYGGYYPWKEESIPVNPHISSKDISGTSDSNGKIHVDINVHAQDR